jgi:hypothetical protein
MFSNQLNKLGQLVFGKYERHRSRHEARHLQRHSLQVNPYVRRVVCVPAFAYKARSSLRHHHGRSP